MIIGAQSVARMLGAHWAVEPGPGHQRLSDRLRLLILDGRLTIGVVLPGERDLAEAIGTSRTTVGAAYRTLGEHGFLSTRSRARSTVRLPGDPADVAAPERAGAIDLSFAAPAAPVPVLHEAFARALERLPRHFDRHGYDRQGIAELREAVADWYGRRGLATSPEQVMITNGALHAIGLLARSLVTPRDRVLIDHPTYPHAITALAAAGARLEPVALTADGWDVERLQTASRGAALAYLVPDFHNPTGLTMSSAQRARLSLSCPVVIDETTVDTAVDGVVPEPVAVHQHRVISIGSVSKSVWGGLRIGWIRGSRSLLERVLQTRTSTDLGTPVLEQLAAAYLLRTGANVRPEAIDALRVGRDALCAAVREHLPEVQFTRPLGGMSLWATFPDPIATRLAMLAPDHGVTIAAGPRFGVGGAFARNVRLPYTLPPDQLIEAIRRLADAHRALVGGASGGHEPAPVA